jgi:hypothetical protein
MEQIIKKYMAVTDAIDRTTSSVNEISLSAIGTLSLNDLRTKMTELKNNNILSETEFNALFSEETIKELRPYKGTLCGLTDTNEGIISKDYLSDILSFIIGIKLPSASSETAWHNAEKFVTTKLNPNWNKLFDIQKELPTEILIANNYEKFLLSEINNKYKNYGIPIKRTEIYEDSSTTEIIVLKTNAYEPMTPEKILKIKDKIIEEYKKNKDEENYWSFSITTPDVLKSLLRNNSIQEINLSPTLSTYGKTHQIPTAEFKIEIDDDDYYKYYRMMF